MMKRVQVVPRNFETWNGLRHLVVDYGVIKDGQICGNQTNIVNARYF
jgi:hypothetical protein